MPLRSSGVTALLLLALNLLPSVANAEDLLYRARQGDTLWQLCARFTVNVRHCQQNIEAYNKARVQNAWRMQVGALVRIPEAWLKNQPAKAEIIYAAGDIRVVVEGGAVRRARIGEMLSGGAVVISGPRSNASIRFADGSVLALRENSELKLNKLSRHHGTGMVDSHINLLRGSVSNRVNKVGGKTKFRVDTPSATAAVRGTEFEISADEGAMQAEVHGGSVEISNEQKQKMDLDLGYGIQVKKGATTLEATKLLPPPQWAEATKEALPLGEAITWLPIEGASKYRLELLKDSKEDQLVEELEVVEASSPLPKDPNNKSGCYRVRLSAYDALKLKGMPAYKRICTAPMPDRVIPKLEKLKDVVKLTWASDDKAKAYRIEVSNKRSFKQVESFEANEPYYEFPSEKKKPYFVRVVALSEYGIEAKESKVVTVSDEDQGIFVVLSALAVILIALL